MKLTLNFKKNFIFHKYPTLISIGLTHYFKRIVFFSNILF